MEITREQINFFRQDNLGFLPVRVLEGLCPMCAEPIDTDELCENNHLSFYNKFGFCSSCIYEHEQEDDKDFVEYIKFLVEESMKSDFGLEYE